MSTPAPELTLVAGRYRLGPLLGQGGMGRVWAAHDEVLERGVAVKEVLVPPAVPEAEREALVARTLREARAAARVRHPRVVTVYDVVEHDARPWIVLQLLAPRTLADVLAEEGPLDPARAARIGLQVLDGLTAVHAAGVLHRDVKPGNVLFGPDGDAVLADFGVAALDDDAAVTSTGLVLGSPAYLAPERARGATPTPAADLWSLGATLFAAVEGRSPFHRHGPLPTLGALLTEDVPAAPAAGALAPAVAALLTKDPAARADADRARALLEAALTSSAPRADVTAVMPVVDLDTAALEVPAHLPPQDRPAPAPSPVPAPRRRRALLAAAAVAVLCVPVTALADRSSPAGTGLPAAASGAALFSTTPKALVSTGASTSKPATVAKPAARPAAATTTAKPTAGTTRAVTGIARPQVGADAAEDAENEGKGLKGKNVKGKEKDEPEDDDKGKGDKGKSWDD